MKGSALAARRHTVRCVVFAMGSAAIAGCLSSGIHDGDFRFVGVVERTQKVNRTGAPAGVLGELGMVGDFIHRAGSSKPANLHSVRTSRGQVVTAEVDEDFALGTCVEVIPTRDALAGISYSYGRARMVPSDKCAAGDREPAK